MPNDEDVPGDYWRMKRTHTTPAGEFYAFTRHNVDTLSPNDFLWQQRYIHTLDDIRRLAEAPRPVAGTAGTNSELDVVQMIKYLDNIEAYIEAGLEFGAYPISI